MAIKTKTEEIENRYRVCDFCDSRIHSDFLRGSECIVCKKDICHIHRVCVHKQDALSDDYFCIDCANKHKPSLDKIALLQKELEEKEDKLRIEWQHILAEIKAEIKDIPK